MAELIWSPTAIADIESIAEYIGKDSVKAASNQVQTLFDRAEILRKYPEIGSIVPELRIKKYKQLLCGRYRIIYKIESEQFVHILTIHHQARLLQNSPAFKEQLQKRKKN
jgi:addiction module RelE/StbE family toxin